MGVSIPLSKDPSVDVTSFFKVMIAGDFSEVMFLPPKFAKAVPNLIDQKIQLEDASGRRWIVSLSKHNGFLAFQKGWHDFSVENDLKIGDFLVFDYLKHAQFRVRIYDRSGCEKKSLPEYKKERKRKGSTKRSSGRDKRKRKTDFVNVDVQDLVTSVVFSNVEVDQTMLRATDYTSNPDDENNLKDHSNTKCTEEPFYMINIDIRVGQGELRDSLYDLESLEMRPCDVCGAGETVEKNKRSPGTNETIPNFKGEVNTVGEILISKETKRCLVVPDIAKSEIMEKSKGAGKDDNRTPSEKNDSHCESAIILKQCSNTDSGKEQFPISQKQDCTLNLGDQSSHKKSSGSLNFIYMPTSVKPEPTYSCGGKEQFQKSQKLHGTLMFSDQSSHKILSGGLNFSNLPISVKPEPNSYGKEQFPLSQKQHTAMREIGQSFDNKIAGGLEIFDGARKSLKEMKQEQVETTLEPGVCGGPPGYQWIMKLDPSYTSLEVKDEHLDIIDFAYKVAVTIPFIEALEKQPYLELNDRLLPVSPSAKQRAERKLVVYLQGTLPGTWPVLYYERFGHKVLTNGWEAFRKANGIGPGDKCVFGLKVANQLIFRVKVLQKQ